MNTKELDNQYVAHAYGRFDVCLTKGKGAVLYDEDGKRYIDFGSGIGVNAFGACDDEWKAAVTAQLDRLQHASNLYYTEPCAELALLLCEKTGFDKVFFANSGAEANEGAIKFARKYSFDTYGEGRKTIITLTDSFHGRTIATLTATGQDEFHTVFGPFADGFKYCPAGDCDALKEMATDDVCAIMFECIQGEGGVNVLSKEFLQTAALIAKEKDILLICDEVQTGNGRTGKYFAYEHYGIQPDIVTTAKGLGGGLPIGAVLFGEKVAPCVTPSSHGSTFGGNPIAAAGAVSIVKRMDEAFLQSVSEKGAYLKEKILAMKNVKDVDGIGMMLGIDTDKNAAEAAKACLAKGLLVLTAHHNRVRLLPPLSITKDEIDSGLKILQEVLEG